MEILKIRGAKKERTYYPISVAWKLITGNKYGLPVDGMHSESLRRSWRDTGVQHGTTIGRDIFFTEQNLVDMGYQVDTDKYLIPEKYVVYL